MIKFFVFVIILFIVISAEELGADDVYITGNLTESKQICLCPKLDCSWTAYDAKQEMQCFCWCSKQMGKFVPKTAVCSWMASTHTSRGSCKMCGTSDGKTHRELFVVFFPQKFFEMSSPFNTSNINPTIYFSGSMLFF